jgi:hypothetical protein
MTYQQAQQEVMKTPWKTETCFSGPDCWCRVISPVTPVEFGEGDRIDYLDCIVSSGGIGKDFAEHVVSLHNKSLEL